MSSTIKARNQKDEQFRNTIMPRRNVAVLGSTGIVAQRLQQRLAIHPWFELVAVVGSKESAGMKLSELPWRLEEERPVLQEITVIDSSSSDMISQLKNDDVEFIFSALPNDVAATMEIPLAEAGFNVFSNSSQNRCREGIPLVVADLNPHHLLHYKSQKWLGSLACSTNCTVIPVALPLKALWDMVGFNHVSISSEQALSGAGWKLLSDQNALAGKVDSNIPGEAEKIDEELRYILGRVNTSTVVSANFTTEVKCARVPEKDGHLVRVEVHLSRDVEVSEVKEWMRGLSDRPQHLKLPSAPNHPIVLIDGIPNRKQHLWMGSDETSTMEELDATNDLKAGMAVTVGNIEMIAPNILRFIALSHNTVRGAAGGCVLLAELALAEKLIGD